MDRKRVLVTGVGGNVGQGIIRNIRKCDYNIEVIGTNIIDFSAGNHLCDKFYKVPYAYDEAFITTIQKIVAEEKIDLIIPSTDFEVFYLVKHKEMLGTRLAASGPLAAEIYLDKYLSFQHHRKFNIPFADSILPSAYNGDFNEFILKPRMGRGSRGIHINPADWSQFSDEEYMIQQFSRGQEITTAFYVNLKGELHGLITLLRSLENGATSQCKVVFEHDHAITAILKEMIRHTDLRGAANLQSIVTEDGSVIPFEVNCRISGTNSIRSNFGFEDVKYTIQEYLFNNEPDQPAIISGVAVRVLMDVIYPGETDYVSCKDNSTRFHLF